jgi:glycine/D-amino acid oxidase-like deaminating enzyme
VRGQNLIFNYIDDDDDDQQQKQNQQNHPSQPRKGNLRDDEISPLNDKSSSVSNSYSRSKDNDDSDSNNKVPLLDISLLRGEYIVPSFQNPCQLVCGATHEYKESFDDLPQDDPDPSQALELLQPKLSTLYPSLFSNNYKLHSVNAGIRVMSERSNLGKIPLISVHSEYSNIWLLAGLGARGLIHHAYMAKTLVDCITETIDSTNSSTSQKLASIPKDIQL